MEQLTAICLDAAAVGIVLWCMNSAAKKGFLRTVVQMVAYVAILLASSFLSRAAAPMIYDHVVQPMIFESVRPEQEKNPDNAALISMVPRGTLSMSGTALDSLNDLISDGLKDSGLLDDLKKAALRPLMISAISMIGFFIIFSALSILSNLLLSALGVIDHIPVIGTVNAVLGGAVGVFQGLLLVLVLCILLKGLLHLHPGGWSLLNETVLDRTYLCSYLLNLDLIGHLFA